MAFLRAFVTVQHMLHGETPQELMDIDQKVRKDFILFVETKKFV